MSPLTPLNTEDNFLHLPSVSLSAQTLLFFIPGNPGLLSYYTTFLTRLSQVPSLIVSGLSLSNFETSTPESRSGLENDLLYPPGTAAPNENATGLISLQEQIRITLSRVRYLTDLICERYECRNVRVILVGHSVGAYIALEVLRLWRSSHGKSSDTSESTSTLPSPSQSVRRNDLRSSDMHGRKMNESWIQATFLLTPTIINIAHSPSGRLVTPILSTVPFFPALVQFSASTFLNWMSDSMLGKVVSSITGLKGNALTTTCRFLRSERGIKQALSMAGDEMREIKTDQWTDEVWGAVGEDKMKHYFLFAKEDHWVANVTRNEILEAAGRRGAGSVVVDEDGELGLVHAWCTTEKGSEVVAEIVSKWLEEVMNS